MEEKIARLERDFKALELDWDNVYDKLRKAMARTVKSRAIIEAKERDDEGTEVTPSTSPGGDGHRGPFLSDRQKQIQQQILRRRAGG